MNNLQIRKTRRKGRGVFALRVFKKGELIESCPIILFPTELAWESDELETYVYGWCNGKDALLLGYGSIYNHSYRPNARYDQNFKKKTVDFYAYKDIAKGQEIVVSYNGYDDDGEPLKGRLWFKDGRWGGYE